MMEEIFSVRPLSDIERAAKAKADLVRLENRQTTLQFELMQNQTAIQEARILAEKLNFAVQRSGALPDPPLPTLEELLEQGKRQNPHRDPKEIAAIAARIHSAISPGAGREGMNVEVQAPMVEGDLRYEDDRKYDLPPPSEPIGATPPKFTKTYE